jgi:hypothetical protein
MSIPLSKNFIIFANKLHHSSYIIPTENVLNCPGDYLGPNWERVLKFWAHLSILTNAQLEFVEDRLYGSSREECMLARSIAYEVATCTTIYADIAGSAAYDNVSYAGGAAYHATAELIGGIENLFYVQLFYNL